MKYNFRKAILFSWLLSAAILSSMPASAMDTPNTAHIPSTYAVWQQEGATCPFIAWDNLQKVRGMRRGSEGAIQITPEDCVTKLQSYAWFLPRMRAFFQDEEDLRQANGAYAAYDADIRQNGIKSDYIFTADGTNINELHYVNPLNQARRNAYTPYNFENKGNDNWLPVLVKNGQQYVYDYVTKVAKPLETFKDEDLVLRGFTRSEILYPQTKKTKFGSEADYYIFPDNFYHENTKSCPGYTTRRYLIGTYQHMLFACGIDNQNLPIAEGSPLFPAYREFHDKVSSNPLNPWSTVNKEDLLEYHLTEVFKADKTLAAKAKLAVAFYNSCWTYYKESLDFYDGPNAKTAIKMSNKQQYLPGEDQCLAYYVASQARLLWAASISTDAVIAVTELDEDLGEDGVDMLKKVSWIPGAPSAENIIKEAQDKKFSLETSWFASNKFSFLDVWKEIQPPLLKHLAGRKDVVTFFGHGCVSSFDSDLVKHSLPCHANKEVAQELGFTMWESLYDRGLKPFYRRPGTQKDVMIFEESL